jgi:hypothetical protein
VRDALEAAAHGPDEELPSPDRPIVAVSGAVERHAQDASIQRAALGEDAGHVRAVVLHGDGAPGFEALSSTRRCVLRVAVVDDGQVTPPDAVHRDEIVDCPVERLERRLMGEIADVLADRGLPVHDDRNGVLEIASECEDRAIARQRRNGAGREAARSP